MRIEPGAHGLAVAPLFIEKGLGAVRGLFRAEVGLREHAVALLLLDLAVAVGEHLRLDVGFVGAHGHQPRPVPLLGHHEVLQHAFLARSLPPYLGLALVLHVLLLQRDHRLLVPLDRQFPHVLDHVLLQPPHWVVLRAPLNKIVSRCGAQKFSQIVELRH